MMRLALPDRPRVLVVTLRRLGDVLLTTALTRTLRRGWPAARIDLLVFEGTEGILAGNPDIDRVETIAPRASAAAQLALFRRIARRYDLAIATHTGDRPVGLALAAGAGRAALVPRQGGGAWWERRAVQVAVPAEPANHRVTELMRLAAALDLQPHADVVCPQSAGPLPAARRGAYAVLHANPMFRYRRWTDAGWRSLALALARRGLSAVVTGGPDAAERAYLDALWDGMPVERLDGRLDWPQLTALLRGAAVYVGADTSVTHLAAAAGCPTVALFGPTDPRLWGPWPAGGLDRLWEATGAVQQRGNVFLVQHTLSCTPCQREGCERHLDSPSACLDGLSMIQVLDAVDRAMQDAGAGRGRAAATG
jgi:heptosyltransferase-3